MFTLKNIRKQSDKNQKQLNHKNNRDFGEQPNLADLAKSSTTKEIENKLQAQNIYKDELRKDIKKLSSKETRILSKNIKLDAKLKSIVKECGDINQQKTRLEDKIQVKLDLIEEKETDIEKLKSELSLSESNIVSNEVKIEELEKEIADAEVDILQKQGRVTEFSTDIEAGNKKIKALLFEINCIEQKYSDFQQDYFVKDEESRNQVAELEELTEIFSRKENELTLIQQNIEDCDDTTNRNILSKRQLEENIRNLELSYANAVEEKQSKEQLLKDESDEILILKESVRANEEKLESYRASYDSLTIQCEEMTYRQEGLNASLLVLEEEIENKKIELAELNTKLTLEEITLAKVTDKVSIKELEAIEISEIVADINEKITTQRESIESNNQILSEYTRDKELFWAESVRLEKISKELETDISETEEKIYIETNSLSEVKSKRDLLLDEYSIKSNKFDTHDKKYKAVLSELNNLKSENSKLRMSIENYENETVGLNRKYSETEAEIITQREIISERQAECSIFVSSIKSLNSNYIRLARELVEINEQTALSEANYAEAKLSYEQSISKNNELEEQISEKNVINNNLNDEVLNLKKAISTNIETQNKLSNKALKIDVQNNSLEQEITPLSIKHSNFENELKIKMNNLELINLKSAQMNSELEKTQRQESLVQEQLDELDRQIEAKNTELNRYGHEMDNVDTRVALKSQELTDKEKELMFKENELLEHRSNQGSKSTKLKALESELSLLDREYAKQISSKDAEANSKFGKEYEILDLLFAGKDIPLEFERFLTINSLDYDEINKRFMKFTAPDRLLAKYAVLDMVRSFSDIELMNSDMKFNPRKNGAHTSGIDLYITEINNVGIKRFNGIVDRIKQLKKSLKCLNCNISVKRKMKNGEIQTLLLQVQYDSIKSKSSRNLFSRLQA